MKRANEHWVVGLFLCGTVGTTSCGNLSNEDLLFLAAVPKREEIALVVKEAPSAASASQSRTDALVGQEADLYRSAEQTASDVNTGVANLLDLVDSLGKGYPPTTRTENSRIWGPVSNVDGEGWTLQLEITRQESSDQLQYVFCLRVARDEDVAGDAPPCLEPDAGGFVTPLAGTYSPQAPAESARSGQGEITLDFEAMHRIGAGQEQDRGILALQYDFTGGGEAKQIHVEAQTATTTGAVPATFTYDYGRTAEGYVDFFFEIQTDHDPAGDSNQPDSYLIDASWEEDGLGRADAQGRGGDLRPTQHIAVTECWDENALRTYYYVAVYENQTEQLVLEEEGNAADCP